MIQKKVYANITLEINKQIEKLVNIKSEKRIKNRISKFSKMGIYGN